MISMKIKKLLNFIPKGFMLEEKDVFELYSEGYKKGLRKHRIYIKK